MVDWDEILEDVNWTRAIIFFVVGLVVIGVLIFGAIDFSRYASIKTQLDQDAQTVKELIKEDPAKDIQTDEKRKADLEGKIGAYGSRLPTTLEQQAVEGQVQTIADKAKLGIGKLAWRTDKQRYLSVTTLTLEIVSNLNRSHFLYQGLRGLDPTAKVKTEENVVTLTLYHFDQVLWDDNHKCDEAVAVPQIPERDITKAKFFGSLFGDNLATRQNAINQDMAKIKNLAPKFKQACQIKAAADRLAEEEGILKDLATE